MRGPRPGLRGAERAYGFRGFAVLGVLPEDPDELPAPALDPPAPPMEPPPELPLPELTLPPVFRGVAVPLVLSPPWV